MMDHASRQIGSLTVGHWTVGSQALGPGAQLSDSWAQFALNLDHTHVLRHFPKSLLVNIEVSGQTYTCRLGLAEAQPRENIA